MPAESGREKRRGVRIILERLNSNTLTVLLSFDAPVCLKFTLCGQGKANCRLCICLSFQTVTDDKFDTDAHIAHGPGLYSRAKFSPDRRRGMGTGDSNN